MKDAPRELAQRDEEAELDRREIDVARVDPDAVRVAIDPQRAEAELRVLLRLAPPEHRLHAQRQLAHAEGLGHVVVGADLEARDALLLGGERAHDDDGDVTGRRIALQRATHFEPAHVGEQQVEQDEVGSLALRDAQPLVSARGRRDLVAGGREVVAQRLEDVGFVFDDQEAEPREGWRVLLRCDE